MEGSGQVGSKVGVEDEMDFGVGNDIGGRAGAVTGVRGGICVGDGVCASWGGVQVGCASYGGQIRVVMVGYSSRSLQVVNSWFPFFVGVSLPITSSESTRGRVGRCTNHLPLLFGHHSSPF
jgi:hypothetical protein